MRIKYITLVCKNFYLLDYFVWKQGKNPEIQLLKLVLPSVHFIKIPVPCYGKSHPDVFVNIQKIVMAKAEEVKGRLIRQKVTEMIGR